MADGSDGLNVKLRVPAPCRFKWCDGRYCADRNSDEQFHLARVSSEGSDDAVGVELVCNDFADGTTSGPLVDITFTDLAESGVSRHSAGLSPMAALRHAEAVIKAALAALAADVQ
jgi:hypothetical protein